MSNTKTKESGLDLSQVVGAILRDIAKARVTADRYSKLIGLEYRESIGDTDKLISFPVPRAEISDVNVKLKFAIDEVKKAEDSEEANKFFFNQVIEKYVAILTDAYLEVAKKVVNFSSQQLQSYQTNIKDSIVQWIQIAFVCEISEDQKNLQIQINKDKESIKEEIQSKTKKEEILKILINDFSAHLQKTSISLNNIFTELHKKTNPTAKDIVDFYKSKKGGEAFKRLVKTDNAELLTSEYQAKIRDLCNTVKKIAKELWLELDSLKAKYLEYRKSDGVVNDLWDAASTKKSRAERDAAFNKFIAKYNQRSNLISSGRVPKIWNKVTPNPREKYKDYPYYKLYINDIDIRFDVGTHKGFGEYNAEKENINEKILPIFFNELRKSLQVYFNLISKKTSLTIAFNIPVLSAGTLSQKWENTILWKEQKFLKITNISAIDYGNGMWVAVRNGGTIITSSNGISWTKRISNATQNLYGIGYGNSMWVAVGVNGTIITSSNGISWTKKTSNATQNLYGIGYGKGMWVAVGGNGLILTSNNGENWKEQTNPAPTAIYGRKGRIRSIAYGNGMWVAVGDKGFIIKSYDGISWTLQASNTKLNLYHIAYGNGMWVVVGDHDTIVTSNDSISWTNQVSNMINTTKIIYDNEMWFVFFKEAVFTRNDENNSIKDFISEIYNLEQQYFIGDGQKKKSEEIQKAIETDSSIKDTIEKIPEEKRIFKKDEQIMIKVSSDKLKDIPEEQISEIAFKTNIKNYKWLKDSDSNMAEDAFNLIPEE